ncbi:MAG: nucleotidyltransferase domain-containing protein [Bacteroidetes bacterium]|nr:nucleotidyltransferase domain-containing protein [Bacteroidota bacterium]MBS1940933.1 nucleotidyltransferase domain-containing protein [Bacteroidota bacterium]
MIATLINKDRQGFLDLCIRNRVAYIYAFGSSVTGNFGPDSDVDVLLDVDVKEDLEAGRALWDMWDGLEAFFQRRVDMLTEKSLRNPYLIAEIERTKVKIYDGASRQILV